MPHMWSGLIDGLFASRDLKLSLSRAGRRSAQPARLQEQTLPEISANLVRSHPIRSARPLGGAFEGTKFVDLFPAWTYLFIAVRWEVKYED